MFRLSNDSWMLMNHFVLKGSSAAVTLVFQFETGEAYMSIKKVLLQLSKIQLRRRRSCFWFSILAHAKLRDWTNEFIKISRGHPFRMLLSHWFFDHFKDSALLSHQCNNVYKAWPSFKVSDTFKINKKGSPCRFPTILYWDLKAKAELVERK